MNSDRAVLISDNTPREHIKPCNLCGYTLVPAAQVVLQLARSAASPMTMMTLLPVASQCSLWHAVEECNGKMESFNRDFEELSEYSPGHIAMHSKAEVLVEVDGKARYIRARPVPLALRRQVIEELDERTKELLTVNIPIATNAAKSGDWSKVEFRAYLRKRNCFSIQNELL
ncbi:unnamed protein product [Lepeophtheirus salmonis]|uniref:(salmon louse) hypothetical protein n=1 Tax=Lepeophtheirus salmonis TaxID=72036 RepID=A0A7R8H835_LEPSM|nr:unnamed protein product [Lepeophtheirus salmonis]CAF2922495.1 unnamed protein product [Lepeophtheirus salmonis]